MTTDLDLPRSCFGKRRYMTPEHAEAVRAACERERGVPLRVYVCPTCGVDPRAAAVLERADAVEARARAVFGDRYGRDDR